MAAIIQVTNTEWRAITERAIYRAAESLTESERAAVHSFIQLAEPHIESIQVELLREPQYVPHEFQQDFDDLVYRKKAA